ncbi:hypothetical protein [uncultured Hymenobacter sp.]|uniref:hypothetical protein n=1 Tax=uncultured Hymenobacter sp. TaxID=170016 RepID=UPI0035CC57B4
MKKSALFLSAAALALLALGLPACSREAVGGGEMRASSPEAAEFNRDISEGSRTSEETRDSAAAGGGRRQRRQAAPQ